MTPIFARSRRVLTPWVIVLLMGMPMHFAVAQSSSAEANAMLADVARDVTALNVSIAVFDSGVPADPRLQRDQQIFPRIREIEAMFLPFVLRETLVNSRGWGAVRVVPQPDVAAELLITGAIVRSDGETLVLKVRAVDASGRVWFDKAFTGVVTDNYAQNDDDPGMPGYQRLYDEIATSLQLAREQLNSKTLTDIVEISLLRYASELAPSAFGDYLNQSSEGTFTILRLPAKNDPMLSRIDRLRRIEYVITDAVDAKFRELHAEIASTYDLWRKYQRKVLEYEVEDTRRAQDTESGAPRGSYEAMKNSYDNYKYHRVTAQEQDRLAVAFNNELSPTVEAMELRVAELQGWVDNKYTEWHRLLEELFAVESGLE